MDDAGEAIVVALAASLDHARLRANVPLAPLTTFRIGGPADALYDATSGDDLANAVTAARRAGIPWMVLGLGANVLVGDRGVRGLVIRNATGGMVFDDASVTVDSGVIVRDLIRASIARDLSGLEHFVGIPSTVGGALWQNLHFLSPAPERDRTMFIADVVESVDLLLPNGTRTRVRGREMGFGYDTSRLHDSGEIALSAMFRLERGERMHLDRIAQENLSWRGARHPWLEIHPSVGSIFQEDRRGGRRAFDRPVRSQGSPDRRGSGIAFTRKHHRERGRGHRRRGPRPHRTPPGNGISETWTPPRTGNRVRRRVLTRV